MESGRRIGIFLGVPLAMLFAAASLVRRTRSLHPRGLVFAASATPVPGLKGSLAAVGARLQGEALIRASNSAWKTVGRPVDLLGFAIRFGWRPEHGTSRARGTQDLLVATLRHVWTLPFAPFTTKLDSFFANHYFSVSPFCIDDLGEAKFRIVPFDPPEANCLDRESELLRRVESGHARFLLQVSPRRGRTPWLSILRLDLKERLNLDQESLRFDPFNSDLGIVPVGFINGLRKWAYRASQALRPMRQPTPQRAAHQFFSRPVAHMPYGKGRL